MKYLLKWILILSMIVTACSFKRELIYELYSVPDKIDIDLYNYLFEFQLYAKDNGVDLKDIDSLRLLVYGDPQSQYQASADTVGICMIWTIGIPGILEIENWKEIVVLSVDKQLVEQKLVVFHELGHCLLGLEHFNSQPDIMNEYLQNLTKEDFDKSIKRMFLEFKQKQAK